MASKHQPPNDREFFAHLRRSDRSHRKLQRELKRSSDQRKAIDQWMNILETSDPNSAEEEEAVQHVIQLLDSPPDQDTWRDEFADGWNDMVWTVKGVAFTSLQMLLIVVFNIIWWAFLIIVALPIVWDWFWQLPPGLK
jgi:hypothetical protein